MKMTLRVAAVCFSAFLLSACATTVPENGAENVLQQTLSKSDKAELNAKLNIAHDDIPLVWRNSEGDTNFELTTSNTHVNNRGLPCRDYVLVIDRDFHSKITLNTTSCRDGGQWESE